jgi:PERQ amino acid-rich with GYF domain-containing protein
LRTQHMCLLGLLKIGFSLQLFSASVNSPLKPPPTNAGKENANPGTTGRKSSISYTQGHINNYNTSSPNAARPGARRRETGDSVANPMSPTGTNTRFFRDEANTSTPPPALLRRKTDFREPNAKDDKPKEGGVEAASPFGSLKRSSTNPLNTAIGGPSSPWGAASASHNANFSPMGAFGAFSLGSNTAQTPTTEKKAGFGSLRGESRFKDLLSKEGVEDIPGSAKEKPLGNLERLTEEDSEKRAQSPWGDAVKTRASRSETNPFDEPRSGSAALGGSQDVEAPSQADLGFGAFGMTSSIPGFRELMQSQENSRNPTPSLLQGHEPTSPTNTNPYQSPHGDRTVADAEDVDTDGSDIQHPQHPGLSGLRDPSNPFGSMRRVGSGMDLPTIDRSQNSSVNANRNFSGLGGLGGGLSGLGGPSGWPTSDAIGTPTRERSAFVGGFGDPIFGTMGGLQSPSLSTLGGGGLFSPHAGLSGTASIGRSSKLGALFSGMAEEQARSESAGLEQGDAQQGGQASKPGSNSASQTPVSAVGSIPANLTHDPTQAPTPGGSISAAQQRTMVMPDRMRWIYRDPQGNIQGPWTGLEMHDWFKAGFFSPDLQIKKLEDGEFEPLAQLVRRIGNSREPFLVPQIGIPHGPEPAPGQWQNPNQGSAQPPFPGSFPSFGTTLTAEQQNALERRKQEEQYLMARQKEHLAQQQAIMKQMQVPGAPPALQPQLQHQSSAHSLHSQPSFGSITSPAAYQPSPIQAPIQGQQQSQGMPGFFDAAASLRQGGLPNVLPGMLGTELGSQDQLPALLDRLNVGRQDPFAFGAAGSFSARQPDSFLHSQQVASMLQDRAQLQQEQDDFDKANANDPFDQEAREERLRQFHALRAQEGELGLRTVDGLPTHPAAALEHEVESLATDGGVEELEPAALEPALTLSQQVHKAASAQRQQQQQQEHEQELEQQHQSVPESAWAKIDHAMPQPFPPPPSASPLPAPAAQRNRQYVAESLAAGSRSQTQTPIDAAPTSVAPWAKDTHEVPKGPSLKEIQEAEARTAAQREEVAAAARRAQLLAEQERLSQAQAQVVPGLPSSANWASAGSPATPSSAGSPWNTKSQPVQTNTATKKTLAQIQKEEEARKQRLASAAAAAAQTATPSPPASAAKRYADLASKAPAPVASPTVAATASGAWTTVGAGGKAKAPPVAPLGPRSTSGTVPIAPAAAKPRPVVATRTTVGSVPQSNPNRAVEEFTKWAKLALGKGLNSNINVDDFVQQLLFLPAEAEIISDSVYANSQTLDGRRFADEFIRRRKLADKGVVDPVSPSAFAEQKNGGGWSEVAKKGSAASTATSQQREEEASNAAFKVVAPRKKGKR